jgi:hypothetical protein
VLDARLRAQLPDSRQAVGGGYRGIRLTALVSDASGALHAIDAGRLSIDDRLQRAVIELEEGGGGGTRLAPARPLAVAAVQLAVEIPPGALGSGTLRLAGIQWAPAEDPDGWRPLRLPAGDDGWSALSGDTFNPPRPLGRRNLLVAPSDGTVLLGETGFSTSFIVGPAGLAGAADVPISVIVNERFLDLTSTRVGDELEIGALADRRRVVIAGVVRGFPTVDPDAGLAIADVRRLALHDLAGEGRLPFVDEWWLAASDDSAPAVATALEAPPFDADAAASAVGTARQLANDPVALGLIGALILGALAAVLFAVVAFVLGAAVSAGERLTEFALLRALGLSPAQLSGWLSLESAFLLLLGLGAGAGIGLLVAWVVLPLVTLTPDGTAAVPEPAMVVPWPALAGLAALAVGALLATVLVLGAVLRRLALAAALRGAEE